jgi:hypothetical protein
LPVHKDRPGAAPITRYGDPRLVPLGRDARLCRCPHPDPPASIGWAVFPEDGCDFEALLRAADERMLRRKRLAEPAAV